MQGAADFVFPYHTCKNRRTGEPVRFDGSNKGRFLNKTQQMSVVQYHSKSISLAPYLEENKKEFHISNYVLSDTNMDEVFWEATLSSERSNRKEEEKNGIN